MTTDDLVAAVATAVTADGWSITDLGSEVDGERHWRLEGGQDPPTRHVLVVVHERSGVVACYSVAVERVEPELRGAVAELLTMANYGLVEGNFELDLGDGEVRFKTSAFVVDTKVVPAIVERLLTFNSVVFDLYRPALEAVAAGRFGPTAALATVEGG